MPWTNVRYHWPRTFPGGAASPTRKAPWCGKGRPAQAAAEPRAVAGRPSASPEAVFRGRGWCDRSGLGAGASEPAGFGQMTTKADSAGGTPAPRNQAAKITSSTWAACRARCRSHAMSGRRSQNATARNGWPHTCKTYDIRRCAGARNKERFPAPTRGRQRALLPTRDAAAPR